MPLIIDIRVTPSTGRSELYIDKAGRLRAYLKSAPEAGKANRELVKLLSKSLKCPLSAISLVAGATSRSKKIKLDLSLSYEEILSKLGLAIQLPFLIS